MSLNVKKNDDIMDEFELLFRAYNIPKKMLTKDAQKLKAQLHTLIIELNETIKNKKLKNNMDYERAWKSLKSESGYRETNVCNIVYDRTVKELMNDMEVRIRDEIINKTNVVVK